MRSCNVAISTKFNFQYHLTLALWIFEYEANQLKYSIDYTYTLQLTNMHWHANDSSN